MAFVRLGLVLPCDGIAPLVGAPVLDITKPLLSKHDCIFHKSYPFLLYPPYQSVCRVKERYAFAIGLQNKMNAMYAANPEDPNIKPMKMLHDNLILSVTLLPVVMARQVKETRGLDVPVEEMREFLWDLRERTKNSPLPSSTEDFKKMSQKLSKEEFKKMFFSPQSPFLDLQISAEMEEFLKKPSYQPAFAPGAEFKRPL